MATSVAPVPLSVRMNPTVVMPPDWYPVMFVKSLVPPRVVSDAGCRN